MQSNSLFGSPIHAGFPSPADDYIENTLDLNSLLITHPAATFFVRVEGDSMVDAHILSGDILVVDRSMEAYNNAIIIAFLQGEFTVKRIFYGEKFKPYPYLIAENKKYKTIKITQEMDFQVWGVVTSVIHRIVKL